MVEKQAYINDIGVYLPEKVLSNADLEKMVDTSDEWIITRTGIAERRIAQKEEASSDLGIKAAQSALAKAQIPLSEIDFVLVATMTPDYLFPSTAAIIQSKLQIPHAAILDVQAACSGFIYGLSVAKAFIESGAYRNILFVVTEKNSSIIDYTDRSTCVLFGDGAAAAIISDNPSGFLIEQVALGGDGEECDLIIMPAGGSRTPITHESVDKKEHYLKMNGQETFKHAVRRMESAIKECLEKSHLTEKDIQWLIPHQANLRIIEAIGRRFSLPAERVYKTVHKYGNTSGSAVAIAFAECVQEHPIKEEEHVVLVTFGAGLTWGSALLKKVGETTS